MISGDKITEIRVINNRVYGAKPKFIVKEYTFLFEDEKFKTLTVKAPDRSYVDLNLEEEHTYWVEGTDLKAISKLINLHKQKIEKESMFYVNKYNEEMNKLLYRINSMDVAITNMCVKIEKLESTSITVSEALVLANLSKSYSEKLKGRKRAMKRLEGVLKRLNSELSYIKNIDTIIDEALKNRQKERKI